MAAPARMHPQDARIPCPLCGSLIHPIAGRCKHCKADLATTRPQSAAAHGALPALVVPVVQAAPAVSAYAPPAPQPYVPVAAGTPPVGVQQAPRERESSQVLPPRPTGRMQAARGRSVWKNWPMIVIVIASLAIVAAVVLMVWPDKKADPSRNALEPPPAPIRMETERDRPLPPSATPGGPQGSLPPTVPPTVPSDPWSNGNGADPGDIDSIDPPPSPDPYAGPAQPSAPSLPSLGGLDPQKTMALANGITTHFCDRMKSCGNSDPALDMLCGLAKQQAGTASPPTCDAANRCFAQIDAMDCNTGSLDDIGAIVKLGQSMQSCIEATKC